MHMYKDAANDSSGDNPAGKPEAARTAVVPGRIQSTRASMRGANGQRQQAYSRQQVENPR